MALASITVPSTTLALLDGRPVIGEIGEIDLPGAVGSRQDLVPVAARLQQHEFIDNEITMSAGTKLAQPGNELVLRGPHMIEPIPCHTLIGQCEKAIMIGTEKAGFDLDLTDLAPFS